MHYFGKRKWQPTPVLLDGKVHGWKSLVGYSPWGHKESDMTERLHFHFGKNKILYPHKLFLVIVVYDFNIFFPLSM